MADRSRSLVVLMACHNRREDTVRCLTSLRDATGRAGMSVVVSLCDDGSTDGTADAALEVVPDLVLTRGDGSYYWAGGMRAAAGAVRDRIAVSDQVLMLNDDVVLAPDFLQQLEECLDRGADIAVGQVSDPVTGVRTYGALAPGPGSRRLSFRPTETDAEIAAFNGNVVLLRTSAYLLLDGLDARYTHGIADFDLGLRARRAGVPMAVTRGYVGSCVLNTGMRALTDRSVPLLGRWRIAVSPKGLPPREWLHFTSRFGGPRWPLYFVSPYVRAVLARPSRRTSKG